MEYEIISGKDFVLVSKNVSDKLAEGWKLQGNLIVTEARNNSANNTEARYTQVLVKVNQ